MKKVFKLNILVLGLLLMSCGSSENNENLDHVILAVNNLENGINQFKNLTGVEPVYGGIHPNYFTQNVIVSLDDKAYIEIVAPRSGIDSIPDWIASLDSLTPVGWAVATKDVVLTRRKLDEINLATSSPEPGSRITPQADTLEWATFGVEKKMKRPSPFL